MHHDPSSVAAAAAASWGPDPAPVAGAKPAGAPGDVDVAYAQFCAAVRDSERDLYKRALGLTRNAADAQDLTQRTLERGLKSLHGFQPGTNMRLWLMRILVNLFLDDCRRASRGPRLEPLDEGGHVTAAPQEDEAPEPEWARITPQQLEAALATLTPLFRQIYELRVRDKLRYQEIADRLHIPLGTVATRLARARGKLHDVLRSTLAAQKEVAR